MSLFWASLTQNNQTFAHTLDKYKNDSKISISIYYPVDTSFFTDSDIEVSNDISQEAYGEIQDNLEWSLSLPSYHDNISKHIDDYYRYQEKNALISYLYDKDEDEYLQETDYYEYDSQFIIYDEYEEVEEIEA
jgi:hypothetical protein